MLARMRQSGLETLLPVNVRGVMNCATTKAIFVDLKHCMELTEVRLSNTARSAINSCDNRIQPHIFAKVFIIIFFKNTKL